MKKRWFLNPETVGINELKGLLLSDARWIDVRAPLEFAKGHLPGAINVPLLNDDERAQVGTTYKQQGPEAAIALGHELVGGSLKQERVTAWIEAIKAGAGFLYCFRGGLRSQISRQWLREAGTLLPLLEGGYKAGRSFLLKETEELCESSRFLVIAGASGSGKTELLTALSKNESTLDLEGLAAHRGSAFGAMSRQAQPSQAVFENQLALALMKSVERRSEAPLLVEDESWTIGKVTLPSVLFHRMAGAPLVLVVEPMAARVERIFQEYVRRPLSQEDSSLVFDRFESAFKILERRLGGLRFQELRKNLLDCRAAFEKDGDLDGNREWIQKILEWYYDPIYERHLEKNLNRVAFRGNHAECRNFIQGFRS